MPPAPRDDVPCDASASLRLTIERPFAWMKSSIALYSSRAMPVNVTSAFRPADAARSEIWDTPRGGSVACRRRKTPSRPAKETTRRGVAAPTASGRAEVERVGHSRERVCVRERECVCVPRRPAW